MKKYFLLIVSIIVLKVPSVACDMCGCFMGITPYDNQSGINFLYRYRSFNGYSAFDQRNHLFPSAMKTTNLPSQNNSFAQFNPASQTAAFKDGGGTTPLPQLQHGSSNNNNNVRVYSTRDYEVFNVYELRAKYFLHQRIEIDGIMPINNVRSVEGVKAVNHTGLGDITLFAGYHLMRKIEEENLQQRLIVGGGLKLPVGNYYAKTEDGDRIPLLLQPGTGSVDYFGYFNYLIGYKKWGLSINSTYKINGENYYKERISNSTTDYASLFYKIQSGDWNFIPSAQIYYEHTKGVKISGTLQDGTSMNLAMAGAGFDVYFKNISLNTALQYTVFEQTGKDNLGSAGRIVVGLGYNFRQLHYLINKKDNE